MGWVIAGCARLLPAPVPYTIEHPGMDRTPGRSVLALHINLILLRFQHLWCPQKVMVSAADAEEEEAGDSPCHVLTCHPIAHGWVRQSGIEAQQQCRVKLMAALAGLEAVTALQLSSWQCCRWCQ